MNRILRSTLVDLYRVIYNMFNKKNVTIKRKAKFDFKTNFEGYNVIHENSIVKGTYLGRGSYIGASSVLSNSYIGRYCCIAHDVKIIRYSHPISFVSMHPCFYSPSAQAGFTFTDVLKWNDDTKYDDHYCIKVGSDVWIGAHVRIMSGVELGDGCVIAAGSVVVKNVEPYAIMGGVPAKQLKKKV